jgi:hypothetical protein
MFNGYVHQVQARLGELVFDLPLAVVTSSTIPPILGRWQALDRFQAHFVYGHELTIET